MKEKMHCKCYLRYCDDTMGMARTKAEAWAMLNEYDRISSELGLVEASAIVAPIAHRGYGKKRRKRQRGAGHHREKH